jgi:hypothetical protein
MSTAFYASGYEVHIDDIDADLLVCKWCAKKHKNYKGVYIRVCGKANPATGKRKTLSLHRVIYERVIGRELASHEQVDHADCNPLNNTRANLRLATQSQNRANTPTYKSNTTGYKGVTQRPNGKYVARLTVYKRRISLGYFDTAEEAHTAYVEAAKKHYGEFARGE